MKNTINTNVGNGSNDFVWEDKKRGIFGLPWTLTRYKLSKKKLVIDTELFTRTQDEIRLYRIMDITLRRTFGERIFGLGTIHCCSGDKTSPEFDIKRIKNSEKVKDLLSDYVEEERKAYRVGVREGIDNDDIDDETEFHN